MGYSKEWARALDVFGQDQDPIKGGSSNFQGCSMMPPLDGSGLGPPNSVCLIAQGAASTEDRARLDIYT